MDKQLQTVILKYIKKTKEVPRDQIINVINQSNNYERVNVQEAINILEDDKKIKIVGPVDTFALTRKGHEALTPLHMRLLYFIRNVFFGLLKIKVNIDV